MDVCPFRVGFSRHRDYLFLILMVIIVLLYSTFWDAQKLDSSVSVRCYHVMQILQLCSLTVSTLLSNPIFKPKNGCNISPLTFNLLASKEYSKTYIRLRTDVYHFNSKKLKIWFPFLASRQTMLKTRILLYSKIYQEFLRLKPKYVLKSCSVNTC